MNGPVETTWHRLGPTDAFPEGELVARTVEGVPLAVLRSGDTFHAFLDQCPHRGAPLTESGRVLDGKVVCMVHFWAFALPEGRQTHLPDVCLRRYAVRVTGDVLEIESPGAAPV